MNPIHRTHRLSITLAGLAAAVLALPACQGTATAASPTRTTTRRTPWCSRRKTA